MKTGKSMRELSESGKLKTFLDPRLIRALGHPVREHILAVLNERVASGKEIGDEIGADVSAFYHHFEELEKFGCIERVDTRQRRGCKEHRFKAKQTLFFDDARWHGMPATIKADMSASSLQYLIDDVIEALEAGTLNPHDMPHVSWIPALLDAQGWVEVRALMNETLTRLGAVQQEAADRLALADGTAVRASVAMLAYESRRADSA